MDRNTRRINVHHRGFAGSAAGADPHHRDLLPQYFLFLLFYIRFVGRHSWLLTGVLAVASPIFLFFFFEALLKILLPKGYSEPLFYPLYQFIY